MIHLNVEDLLYIAERVLGHPVEVRDLGLLEAAAARPQASAFGADAYPDLYSKAAALLISICKNHALIDGNKRLALAATIAMLGLNGLRLGLTNEEAYDLIIAVSEGRLGDVKEVASRLRAEPMS
ncbi:MAG: type II toxin-antitoxin system death-on-curing family toxin [Actinobacteria bacterium]|nr:type II toxin-antitoxin system death-on-curing family toxin [Actinomycetota bacterium]